MSKRLLAAVAVVAVVPAGALAARDALHPVVASKATGAAVPKGAPRAVAWVRLRLDASTGEACWKIAPQRIGTALSAHVHAGKPGNTGRVVLPLGSRFLKIGCVQAPKYAVRNVARDPALYYVDIHTKRYLDGAVRGQLHPQ
jgi:hypothetical protein